jgi:hypothetical protein
VTANPTAEWTARQLTEAGGWEGRRITSSAVATLSMARFLPGGFASRNGSTAARSPWQNGDTERLIGSLKPELLDHVAAFGERHLHHMLLLYMAYYNGARTHLSLNKEAPVPLAVRATGRIQASPILGGLQHHYVRI